MPKPPSVEIAFGDQVRKVVDYFAMEFNLNYAQAVGVLHLLASDLCDEAKTSSSGDGDGDGDGDDGDNPFGLDDGEFDDDDDDDEGDDDLWDEILDGLSKKQYPDTSF